MGRLRGGGTALLGRGGGALERLGGETVPLPGICLERPTLGNRPEGLPSVVHLGMIRPGWPDRGSLTCVLVPSVIVDQPLGDWPKLSHSFDPLPNPWSCPREAGKETNAPHIRPTGRSQVRLLRPGSARYNPTVRDPERRDVRRIERKRCLRSRSHRVGQDARLRDSARRKRRSCQTVQTPGARAGPDSRTLRSDHDRASLVLGTDSRRGRLWRSRIRSPAQRPPSRC